MRGKGQSLPARADLRPTIVTFWHGATSWLERLSAASFLAAGHRLEVYSYDPVEGLPEGVVLKDARELLPRDKLVFYKGKGTPGVFSDYFRAALMAAEKGIWADLDVVCLRPLDDLPPLVVSYERPGSVNGAVLRIPADHPLLAHMLAIFTGGQAPAVRAASAAAAAPRGGRTPAPGRDDPARGHAIWRDRPFALTHYCRVLGISEVLPSTVFYPIPYADIPQLLEAGSRIDRYVTPETRAIHVWRSQITRRGRAEMPRPAPDSALALLCSRFGIVP